MKRTPSIIILYNCSLLNMAIVTPHAQHERGKVIAVGVHIHIICIYVGTESYFSDRLTFSNIDDRTSRRIRLALPLLSPEMLFSLSKLRIFLFNVHLALFVLRMTQLRLPFPSVSNVT